MATFPVVDYVIDTHSPEPSYVQLAGILRSAIESGEIQPREPLPSITYLVQATGLAVGTVRKAVGVVVATPGSPSQTWLWWIP